MVLDHAAADDGRGSHNTVARQAAETANGTNKRR